MRDTKMDRCKMGNIKTRKNNPNKHTETKTDKYRQ